MALRLNGIAHWIMWEVASLFEHVGTVQDGIATLSRPHTVTDRPGAKPLIVTRGGEGSTIYADGQRYDIPCVQAYQVVDPTGCGDAFRAGMLFGLTRGMDWMTIGRLASLMGALKIESQGGQNHAPTVEAIEQRFEKEFGYRF